MARSPCGIKALPDLIQHLALSGSLSFGYPQEGLLSKMFTLIDWLDEIAGFEIRGHTLFQWSQMSGMDKNEGSEAAMSQFSQTIPILNKALEDILGSGMRLASKATKLA